VSRLSRLSTALSREVRMGVERREQRERIGWQRGMVEWGTNEGGWQFLPRLWAVQSRGSAGGEEGSSAIDEGDTITPGTGVRGEGSEGDVRGRGKGGIFCNAERVMREVME
jgi:hypothetical protein